MVFGGFLVLLLAVIPAVYTGTDYCEASLCDVGTKHIACGYKEIISSHCLYSVIIPLTTPYRRQILRKHNTIRHRISQGFKSFPPATRMAKMVWDNELAKLAKLNVKQCIMRRDQCHNTPKFLFAGQNISLRRWRGQNFTVSQAIDSQIESWFREYRYCPLNVIRNFKFSTGPPYGRFTVMVQDRSTHIGCAILTNLRDGFIQQLMVCNYAHANILDAPVYISGETASHCTNGTDSKFTSLCSVGEKYD